MKITRILPRKLAIHFQEHDLHRAEIYLEYHRRMANGFEQHVNEGYEELRRLKEKKQHGM